MSEVVEVELDIIILKKKSKNVLGVKRGAKGAIMLYGDTFVSNGAGNPTK